LEEGVGCGKKGIGTETREAGEEDICRGVDARASQREDVGFGRVRVEGEAQDEEEDDAAEQDVERSAWGCG
jgi:hypothetical protein